MKHVGEVRISCYLSDTIKFWPDVYDGIPVLRCVYIIRDRENKPQMRCSIWKEIEGEILGLYLRCEVLSKEEARMWQTPTPDFRPYITRVFEHFKNNAFEKEVLGVERSFKLHL